MDQKISILGSGWLGWPVAKYLNKKGFAITSSTRSIQKAEELKTEGIHLCIVDLNDESYVDSSFFEAEIIIIITPVKELAMFERLISFIEASKIRKVIYISSTSVYQRTHAWVTEEVATTDSPYAKIEELFRINKNFESTIIRFAGLFANDRQPGNFFRDGRVIDHPEGFVNLIHRDDCLSIIEQIITQNIFGETFNACADTHPTRRDFYTKEILKVGRPMPVFNEDASNDFKIISNEKLKTALGYSFKYWDLMGDWE